VKAIEKYQEGLMIPPLKLVEAGVMRQDIWNLIMNATRQPEMVGLDMKGLIASNVVARRRFADLIKKYGIATVKSVMKEMIRYSERLMREQIQKLPDGEFETQAFLDHDGHENRVYKTHIRLTKQDSNLIFDFSKSSPQAPGFINCPASTLMGGVFGGFAPVLGFGVPWNQGMLKAISIIAPKGLVCNAEPPAPTGSATIGEGWMVCNAVVNVLSKLMALHPDFASRSQGVTNGTFTALIIGGKNQYGEPYGTQLMDAQLGGGGATAIGDGMDQAGGFLTTNPNIPNVETNELHGPMLYLFRGYMPDTGGPGKFRGGRSAGLAFTPYDIDRLRCAFTTQGVQVPISIGIFGGTPGQTNRQAVMHKSDIMSQIKSGSVNLRPVAAGFPISMDHVAGRLEAIPAKTDEFPLYPGDLWQYTFQGGGGYGDPLLRDPENVLADVHTKRVSSQSARSVYGVVIENDDVNLDATAALRDELRRQRLTRGRAPAVKASVEPGKGNIVDFGPSLRLRQCDNPVIECCCGHAFCHAHENWRNYAASYVYTEDDLPNGIVMHRDLELVEYLCPDCGVLHTIDTQVRGEGPVQDFRLFDNASLFLNQVAA
jgi:N-methylhydantoinase B